MTANGKTYMDPEGGFVTPSMEGPNSELFVFNIIDGNTCDIVLTLNGELVAGNDYFLTLVLTDPQGARTTYPVLVQVFAVELQWPTDLDFTNSLVASVSPNRITLSGSGWPQPDRAMTCYVHVSDVVPADDVDPVSALRFTGYFTSIPGNNQNFGPGGILQIYSAWAAQYNPTNFQSGKKVYVKSYFDDGTAQSPTTYFEAQIS
jgi:hypothetical protein